MIVIETSFPSKNSSELKKEDYSASLQSEYSEAAKKIKEEVKEII